jgi:tetratricopeptide (TPR) repeat protein
MLTRLSQLSHKNTQFHGVNLMFTKRWLNLREENLASRQAKLLVYRPAPLLAWGKYMFSREIRTSLLALSILLLLSACGSSARGPYSSTGEQRRDSVKAEQRYQEALGQLDKDPVAAEAGLREVLGWDLYHGAAHNNLGVLLMKQGKLYDAAEEFEWARKLMPGHPEPRVNLAMALARGGKVTDALDAAKTALEVSPGNLWAIQTVAYLQVTNDLTDDGTSKLIDSIVMRSTDAKWRGWAEKWKRVKG